MCAMARLLVCHDSTRYCGMSFWLNLLHLCRDSFIFVNIATHCSNTATHCNDTATQRNWLLCRNYTCAMTHSYLWKFFLFWYVYILGVWPAVMAALLIPLQPMNQVCCSVLQRVVVCCSVLQRVAECLLCLCSFLVSSCLGHNAVCCRTLQCVAVFNSVLHQVAMCFINDACHKYTGWQWLVWCSIRSWVSVV